MSEISRTIASRSSLPRSSSIFSSSKEVSKWSSIAFFPRPVTMTILSIPAAFASSTTYWTSGRSTSGSISLGCAFVAGRNLVPRPAAGKTATLTRCIDAESYPIGLKCPGYEQRRRLLPRADRGPRKAGPARARDRRRDEGLRALADRTEIRDFRRRNIPGHDRRRPVRGARRRRLGGAFPRGGPGPAAQVVRLLRARDRVRAAARADQHD